MKICLIAQCKPSESMGGGKCQFALAEQWRQMGHEVTLLSSADLTHGLKITPIKKSMRLSSRLESFIHFHGENFDVIDYDLNEVITKRPLNCKSLLVARSVLFPLHRQTVRFPQSKKLKHRFKTFVTAPYNALCETTRERRLLRSLRIADLLNLSTTKDCEAACSAGLERSKIIVFPFALTEEARSMLGTVKGPQDKVPRIVFLGSFDYRKGCYDLAAAFRLIRGQIPNARLTLLGAKGVFSCEGDVLSVFEPIDRDSVDVYMQFAPTMLPELLQGMSLAIFPSYWEGFPFSVLETLGAGIPTIAYNSPGPCDILPAKWLVSPGNWPGIASRCIDLLFNQAPGISDEARGYSRQYQWKRIAKATVETYEDRLNRVDNQSRSPGSHLLEPVFNRQTSQTEG